jgi:hypothetical protein
VSRRKGSGFHPIYLFVDECEVLYGAPHPIGGAKTMPGPGGPPRSCTTKLAPPPRPLVRRVSVSRLGVG